MSESFYWHDYETWGSDTRRDRPCQFAGLRTDYDFNPIGKPLVVFCRPASDLLPQPDACLLTSITPSIAQRKGIPEAEFASLIHLELSRPNTCGVGYNSMRFDDEITRNLFYRNFIDPYARERLNGNSRWDLIDVLRLAHALRPEGILWPKDKDSDTSFRLDLLTAANEIDHGHAHDALADVNATIAIARLLKKAQPRLFAFALQLRAKKVVEELLSRGRPLLHVSARYPARLGCIAPVWPVAHHPVQANGVICYDLRQNPESLLELSADEVHERLFTRDLSSRGERIPLKTLHVNRSPMLAPMATLTLEAAEKWDIDPVLIYHHAAILAEAPELSIKVREAHQLGGWPSENDPDLMIYSGGFFADSDRRLIARVRQSSPHALANTSFPFQDSRLKTMLFRYRARNWPETLTDEEREDWDAWRFERLTDPNAGGSITLDSYYERIAALKLEHKDCSNYNELLNDLEAWAELVMDASP